MTETKLEGLVLGMPELDYHANPALSSTGAKLLLESPAKFDWVINRSNRVEKKAYDVGSAVHALVLGTGYDVAIIPDDLLSGANKAISSDKAKAWVKENRDAGKIPMKEAEYAPVKAMADAVLMHPTGRALLERDGDAEASMFATDPVTGIDLRCRFDFLPADRRVAVDLKKTRPGHARPFKFASTVVEYGYDVSWAHYLLTAELAGEPVTEMVFLVVEDGPPFHILPARLDPDFKEIGEAKARVARDRFARALDTGEWPGYPTEIQLIRPPQFAIYDHIDSQETAA
ncbi:PD-(D/E)XK nuclease-like domain-containing protein [Microbacterium sp. K24]|uniref:PD-(D/E)XK nuclease-like domain-containing protein n=1 Tax=Microbacterium sp. K24 TaxID=2305446 RepID=UPI00109D735F|nr:PD-(D/E)XK nuclease-like domain-containing protein [Microbacterium sp. K24]